MWSTASAHAAVTAWLRRDLLCDAPNAVTLKEEKQQAITTRGKSRMDIKVLKKTPDEMRIEISGEGHTLCNLLQRALLEDETVEIGGYNIDHPLVSNPVVYVVMKAKRKPEKRPETALKEAAERVRHINREFQASFDKALKEWQKK